MATPATSSGLLMLLVTFAANANAATFTITNKCGFTVWPVAIPVGGGMQLDPDQTWTINMPAGTSSGRVWGCTGCNFNGGSGSCQTDDCAGALSCSLSGQPPATLAEFTIGGAQDSYDISVIDGFNMAMQFSCSTGISLNYGNASCPNTYHQPNDPQKTHACNGNSNYQVTFCF